MSGDSTRRGFFRKAAVAGGWAAMAGSRAAPTTARSAERARVSRKTGSNAPLVVVTEAISTDVNPRGPAWPYIVEILERAGLFFERLSRDGVGALLERPRPPIVLLAGDLPLAAGQREALVALVRKGGALVGVGGPSRLDDVFGVSAKKPLAEGWLRATGEGHPVMAGLSSSLHVFGGCAVTVDSATPVANVESGAQGVKGAAIVENRFGDGLALLLGPDLIFSIMHIQQGLPVLQDGKPAPDGSAPLDDGELKAEDGLVLHWRRDRRPMQPDGEPAFLEPISDELREIILRSVFHVAVRQGVTLPMLWYWPRGLKAVGHISHDTDGNDPEKAAAMLDVVRRCGLRTTWCTLYPGGYPKEFYSAIRDQGCEIALHYDARTRGEKTCWSKEHLRFQLHWLLKEAGLNRIISNKNHYTRWEGRLDFWRWCEELGIQSDQTRGPSKKGVIGFPLGGSQPYFPLDDRSAPPRRLNVLEVNLLTQDLVVVCPRQYGKQLVDSVLRHHGVAHFLFHPGHIREPHVADALRELVEYGKAQGLEWWTNQQICEWELLRRSVKAVFESIDTFAIRAASPLRDATLLLLKPRPTPRSVMINGQPARGERRRVYGFEFDAVTTDLAGEVTVRIA